MSNFYKNIKSLRDLSGLNQTNFGKKLGVSRNKVTNWECNKIEPNLDMLIKISKTFDISYEDLLL